MSILKSLLDAYNYCEKHDLVDVHKANASILLPLYHQNMNARGEDIVCISFDERGDFVQADFLAKDSIIIFPITEDSGARSGKIPPPHPLVDKLQYFIKSNTEKYEAYSRALEEFYEYSKSYDDKIAEFVSFILNFINTDDILKVIVQKLYQGLDYTISGTELSYKDSKGKSQKKDFAEVFVTFEVKNFIDRQDISVTTYKKLHECFVSYIEESNTDGEIGICNISGEKGRLTTKHRGLMGTAKVISVSNKKETYYGRFKEGSDIISISQRSSEKIHLMLKYFLENKNTGIWLGDSLYLVNWFSEDINNELGIDIRGKVYHKDTDDELFLDDEEDEAYITDEHNRAIANSFIKGKREFPLDDKYYIMLVDKSSNGRISIRYYRELYSSQLLEYLSFWESKYAWFKYDRAKAKIKTWIPDIGSILDVAYGIERERDKGRYQLKISNEKFRKSLLQTLIESLLDNRSLPKSIINAMCINLRNRIKYPKTWRILLPTTLAVLSENNKEDFDMRKLEEQNRDYLFGRLLAVFEEMERATFSINNDKSSKEKEYDRVSNAEKYWSSYMNRPAEYMQVLENKIKAYEKKLRDSKPGLYTKLNKAKQEIVLALDEFSVSKEINTALNYEFIFGYHAQMREIFTKKENDQDE